MLSIKPFNFKVIALQLAIVALTLSTPGLGWAAVDVNHAGIQELQQIKGIGAKTARRIVAERARGHYESLEHLSERLSGVGPKTIIKFKAGGLCAGTPDHPCAKPLAVSQLSPRSQQRQRGGVLGIVTGVVTPELIELP